MVLIIQCFVLNPGVQVYTNELRHLIMESA